MTNEQARITDIESLIAALQGLSIVGGGNEGDFGFHLELSDGRFLVIEGQFIVGLGHVNKRELH